MIYINLNTFWNEILKFKLNTKVFLIILAFVYFHPPTLLLQSPFSMNFRLVVFLLGFVFLVTNTLKAQVISDFEIDDEGWAVFGNLTTVPTYNTNGGNPGNYLSMVDANFGASPPWWYWEAPAKFLGNISSVYTKNLKFDLRQSAAGTNNTVADVIISNGSITLYYFIGSPPAVATWSSYSVPMREGTWKTSNNPAGANATKAQFQSVLLSTTFIRIRGEYDLAGTPLETGSLDNVILETKTPGNAPIISSLVPAKAKPGDPIVINGSNFSSTASQNIVYFGGIAAAATISSPTQLTVNVPIGAMYGQIIVSNLGTGLSGKSNNIFNPLFDGGGRIIPTSFLPKVDFTSTEGLTKILVGDVDGDGWSDLIFDEGSNLGFGVKRNLGAGGDITTGSFDAKVRFLTGGSSENGAGIQFLDLDGDGIRDIVTSAGASPTVGSFITFRNISTPGNIAFEVPEFWDGLSDESPPFHAADLDGDGLIDLLGGEGSIGPLAWSYLWITQNISEPGDIRFARSVNFDFDLFSGVAAVTSGDLNGDQKPDLVVTSNQGGRFEILRNTSVPGTISFVHEFGVNQGSEGHAFLEDINLDGKLDLIWKKGFSNDDVNIMINSNSGGPILSTDFSAPLIIDSDLLNYGAVSTGDMNGDGKTDLLVSDSRQFGVFESIFTGGAFNANSFIKAYVYPGAGISTYPDVIIPSDVNGDGKPELIVAVTNTSPQRVIVYQNVNTHTPEISITTVSPLAAPVGSSITITGDYFSTIPSENVVTIGGVQATVQSSSKTSITAIVPSGVNAGTVSVTRNRLTANYHLPFVPTFGPGVSTFNNTHFAPGINFLLTTADYDLAVADLNNDGKIDVIADGLSSRSYSFLNTHSTGNISATSLTANDTTNTSGVNPRLFDVDGDGLIDLITGNGVYQNISSPTKIDFMNLFNLASGNYHGFGDFNHDGKVDFVGANATNASVIENRTSYGAFVNTTPYQSFSTAFNFPKAATGGTVVTADFDNDGWMDFASTSPGTDQINVWQNGGAYRIANTQFTSLPALTTLDNPSRMFAVDIDVDGKVDIITNHATGANPSTIAIFHNQSAAGVISFNRVDITLPGAVTNVHASDLDGDGKPDLLATSESTNQFFLLKNNTTPGVVNTGLFESAFSTAVTNPRGLITADINADGKTDIIITASPNSLWVYENLIVGAALTIDTDPSGSTVCEGTIVQLSASASGTTNISYQWEKFNSGSGLFEVLSDDAVYSGTATNMITINTGPGTGDGDYQCRVSGDYSVPIVSSMATVILSSAPVSPVVTDVTSCSAGSITLTATGSIDGNYRWYDVSSGGTAIAGEVNSSFNTPSLSSSTAYYVSINDGLCESARVPITATINIIAKPTIGSSITATAGVINLCLGQSVTLTAPSGFAGYSWSTGEATDVIVVSTAGTYSVVVNDATPCNSPASDLLTVVVQDCSSNMPPVINVPKLTVAIQGSQTINLISFLSDPDDNLDLNTLQIVTPPQSGASATIDNNFNLIIDYQGISFVGTDQLTIQVCDIIGSCISYDIEVEVVGDVMVFNGISPNGDGFNDYFQIKSIESIPNAQNNYVTIYNRWGDLVFEIENYNNTTNVFTGKGKNGKELPAGTYFYKVDFKGNRIPIQGYLIIKQ